MQKRHVFKQCLSQQSRKMLLHHNAIKSGSHWGWFIVLALPWISVARAINGLRLSWYDKGMRMV